MSLANCCNVFIFDSTHSSSNVEIRGLQHMEARILREIKTGEKNTAIWNVQGHTGFSGENGA